MRFFPKSYLLAFILLLSIGCKGNEAPVQPEEPGHSPGPAQAINIEFPKILFTDADKIEEGVRSLVIFNRLIELIDATSEGASIYMSIYHFRYDRIINALDKAHDRGVNLHLMLDMSDRSQNTETANRLTVLGSDVEIVRIQNDAGSMAINHNKFVLFSEVMTEAELVKNVIFQTSQNFTSAGSKKLQDAVMVADVDLYEAYKTYWQDMKARAGEGMKNFEFRTYKSSVGITAYFYPKRKNGAFYGGDTIIEVLDDITDPSTATVKIAMSAWSNSRAAIAAKLTDLVERGAKIEVVTKSSIGANVKERLRTLAENNAFVRIYNVSDSGVPKINIHLKSMMIDGEWQGKQTRLLFTGSQNFTNNALKNNNEVSLMFRDHPFFESYQTYFQQLKKLPATCCSL